MNNFVSISYIYIWIANFLIETIACFFIKLLILSQIYYPHTSLGQLKNEVSISVKLLPLVWVLF